MDDVRNGRRQEGSIVSSNTVDSLLPDEREACRQLRKELESAGVTPDLFAAHQSFIIKTLRDVVNAGAFEANHEECEEALFDIPSRGSSSSSSRRPSVSNLARDESVIGKASKSGLLTEGDEQDKDFIFQTSGWDDRFPQRDLDDTQEPNVPISTA